MPLETNGTPQRIKSYSGYLNQHEFRERCMFIKQRIANRFSREDIAFLLGRTVYEVLDYEELSAAVKMNYADLEVMAALFITQATALPSFDRKLNDTDISSEKRMVRGVLSKNGSELTYTFIHPWTIKGVVKPTVIIESVDKVVVKNEERMQQLEQQLLELIFLGFFKVERESLAIYHHLNDGVRNGMGNLSASMLREVVYKLVRTNHLQIRNIRSKFSILTAGNL